MTSIVYLTIVSTLFLLFSCIKIHCLPANLDVDNGRWETIHYPFPEMSRFLNSNSRIHRSSYQPSSFSLLGSLCSIVDDQEKIEEILDTFGKKYRSLIMDIIEKDCLDYHQRHKRTTINISRKNFPREFLRKIIDNYSKT